MESVSKIDTPEFNRINKLLADHYGMETATGRAMFRLVWAEDEFEIQQRVWKDYSGDLFLREVYEARRVRKYPEDNGKYILEHLVLIPLIDESKLPGQRQSYEPIWTFEDRWSKPLTPVFAACAFVVDTVLAAMGRGGLKKYVAPTEEDRQNRIKNLELELFGHPEKDPLSTGVVVPNNYGDTQ